MIELVARPEKYNGKKVALIGYLNLEFEGNALYLHEEDYRRGITLNGLWVDLQSKAVGKIHGCRSRRYVLIEGTFNAKNAGHMRLWSGALESITRCIAWRVA